MFEGAFSAQPTQVGTHGLPQEDKDTPLSSSLITTDQATTSPTIG